MKLSFTLKEIKVELPTKLREAVEGTVILKGTVISILHDKLGIKKISARSVPRLLSAEINAIAWSLLRLSWRAYVLMRTSGFELKRKHGYTIILPRRRKKSEDC